MVKRSSLIALLIFSGCVRAGSLISESTVTTIQERENLNKEGVITSIDKGTRTSSDIKFKANSIEAFYAKGKGNVDMGYSTDADGSFKFKSVGAHEGEAYVPPEALQIFQTGLLKLISQYVTAGNTYSSE